MTGAGVTPGGTHGRPKVFLMKAAISPRVTDCVGQ